MKMRLTVALLLLSLGAAEAFALPKARPSSVPVYRNSVVAQSPEQERPRPPRLARWAKRSTLPVGLLAVRQLLVGRGGGSAALVASTKSLMASVGTSQNTCWMVLGVTVLLEALSASLSKHARDIGSMPLFVLACGIYLLTMFGFNLALARLEVGVAYAVWSGLGTLLISAIGIVLFGESFHPFKLASLLLIVMGVVGLNMSG